MPKFFTPIEYIKDDALTIVSGDVAHIRKVLRLSVGDVITVCDGKGFDYTAKISQMQTDAILCTIEEKHPVEAEPELEVTLYQGIPKGTKMDYIIQKTTELGIVRIVPCMMERSVVKLEDAKAEAKKVARWQKIAEEAAKQSGRGVIPEVTMPVRFSEAIAKMQESDLCFAPYECEEHETLKSVLTRKKDVKTLSFMIGPEGGFDPAEIQKLQAANISTVTLGKRILRTETAGEAVLAMAMYEIGDINGGKKYVENK